jgi:hypothetical protein
VVLQCIKNLYYGKRQKSTLEKAAETKRLLPVTAFVYGLYGICYQFGGGAFGEPCRRSIGLHGDKCSRIILVNYYYLGYFGKFFGYIMVGLPVTNGQSGTYYSHIGLMLQAEGSSSLLLPVTAAMAMSSWASMVLARPFSVMVWAAPITMVVEAVGIHV